MKKIVAFLGILFVILTNTLFAQFQGISSSRADSLELILTVNKPTGEELCSIYRELMWEYMQINGEKSMGYARKCIETSIPINSWECVSNSYRLFGMHHWAISQYDSAMIYFNKTMEAIEKMRNFPEKYDEKEIDDELSLIYGSIGNLFNIQGKYHEAIDYYTRALKLFEKYGWKKNQSIAYENIGEMYLSMDNYIQAEINFTKFDSLAFITGDSLHIAHSKYQLSHLYLVTKEYNKALRNAELAYDFFILHPEEKIWEAITSNLLAEIYLDGFNDEARTEKYVQQAIQIFDTLGIPREKAISLRIISTLHFRRSEWRKSEQIALEALAIDDSEPSNTLALYRILNKVYAHQGNATKSNYYLDKLIELQSEWTTKNYQSAIREMEIKYETKKKQTQITALETENRLLITEKRLITWLSIAGGFVFLLLLAVLFFLWRWTVQKRYIAEQQILQLEHEKRFVATQALLDGEIQERIRLSRDLHDGLGSLLTGMKQYLQEIKKGTKFENSDIERFNKVMDLLDESAREMRRLSHNLAPDTLSRYGLKPAVDDFCRSLSSKIVFDFYGEQIRLAPKLETFIYRSIHELTNNAMKYSTASQIMVQIMQENDRIAFTVQDDGCGFDPSAETKGTGLKNIRTRVVSYGGNIQIHSNLGEGTEVNVELRIENYQ